MASKVCLSLKILLVDTEAGAFLTLKNSSD